MNKNDLIITLNTLIATAKEHICVAGEDARRDVIRLKRTYMELIDFWCMDDNYYDSIPNGCTSWKELFNKKVGRF